MAAAVLAGMSGRNSGGAEKQPAKGGDKTPVDKAKMAMLCMQRASWEQGVASQALIEMGEKDLVILIAKDAVLRRKNDGRLAMLGTENAVTDPASNGEAVLYAYKVTGDETFKKAADAMYKYLMKGAPKTEKGIICHVTQGRQIWSDSMFMSPPFLAVYGDYDEAIKQVDGYREYLWDKDKKLFSHIWDDQKKVFTRKDCWGGGNGWSAAGMAKIIDILPKEKEAERKRHIGYVKELLDGCIAYMRPDGLFYDVIDKPETFVETNLSQMLAYSIYKGVKAGWLENSYLKPADKMRAGANSKIDRYGVVQDACSSPNFDRAGTSTEAQAFFLMMEAAYSALAQKS
jgi:rhamnogalacturonyl hydrolase YesR